MITRTQMAYARRWCIWCTLAPSVRVVAECLDEKRSDLFVVHPNVSVVCGLQVAVNMLVQDVADPGVSATLEAISSNVHGDTVYSVIAEADITDVPSFAAGLIRVDGNLLSVIRGSDAITRFGTETIRTGDRIIYLAPKRLSWADLSGLLPA